MQIENVLQKDAHELRSSDWNQVLHMWEETDETVL